MGFLDSISIHAPRTGSDEVPPSPPPPETDFNPRSPYGERPHDLPQRAPGIVISIHAPRTGSDVRLCRRSLFHRNFNPRSPYGERRVRYPGDLPGIVFQSTLPVRGATPGPAGPGLPEIISIHAPRTGSDKTESCFWIGLVISIHAPRTGSDGQF